MPPFGGALQRFQAPKCPQRRGQLLNEPTTNARRTGPNLSTNSAERTCRLATAARIGVQSPQRVGSLLVGPPRSEPRCAALRRGQSAFSAPVASEKPKCPRSANGGTAGFGSLPGQQTGSGGSASVPRAPCQYKDKSPSALGRGLRAAAARRVRAASPEGCAIANQSKGLA